jgi:hypothetical protein
MVMAAEELPAADAPEDGRTRQEFDAIYGVKLTTSQGAPTFVFRNSSNGYYGGWACLGTDGGGYAWREIDGPEWRA